MLICPLFKLDQHINYANKWATGTTNLSYFCSVGWNTPVTHTVWLHKLHCHQLAIRLKVDNAKGQKMWQAFEIFNLAHTIPQKNVKVCVCVCETQRERMCMCAYMHACVHSHSYMHACMCVCVHACVCVCVSVCVCARAHTCVCAHACVCVHEGWWCGIP